MLQNSWRRFNNRGRDFIVFPVGARREFAPLNRGAFERGNKFISETTIGWMTGEQDGQKERERESFTYESFLMHGTVLEFRGRCRAGERLSWPRMRSSPRNDKWTLLNRELSYRAAINIAPDKVTNLKEIQYKSRGNSIGDLIRARALARRGDSINHRSELSSPPRSSFPPPLLLPSLPPFPSLASFVSY